LNCARIIRGQIYRAFDCVVGLSYKCDVIGVEPCEATYRDE
jgi:hypothetical protein